MKENYKKHVWWKPSLIMFSRISGWIIGPIILAVILGKFLDNIFHTQHWFFICLMFLSFGLSIYKIVKETLRQIRKIEIDIQSEKQQQGKED